MFRLARALSEDRLADERGILSHKRTAVGFAAKRPNHLLPMPRKSN
jgi:hypothetical protein